MKWNAALILSYSRPVPGREAKAMEVFADALTTFGKLAADDMCAEPEVFHHIVGGGMFIIKTENLEAAHHILEMDDIRKMFDVAMFTVEDFDVEMFVTGEHLMENMSLYTAIGTELGYISA
ncbi:MAG: hypothetical protein QNJ89_10660 [Acidimicrobiia bacterium]|nr:hypothetical protein [Acidimicrobiia bacterium]